MTVGDWAEAALYWVLGPACFILGAILIVRAVRDLRDELGDDVDQLPPLHVVADDDRPLHELIGEANEQHLDRWYEGPFDWEHDAV